MHSVIGKQIGKGFAIAILLMIAAIGYSLIILNSSFAKLENLAKNNLFLTIDCIKINLTENKKGFIIKRALLNPDKIEAEIESYREQKRKLNGILQDIEQKLNNKNIPNDKINQYIKYYDTHLEKTQTENKIVNLLEAGEIDEARKTFRNNFLSQSESLENLVQKFRQESLEKTRTINKDVLNRFNVIIIVTILAFTLALAVGFYIIHKVNNSLYKLHLAAMKIRNGEIDEEINIDSKDEMHELGLAFDRMRKSLLKANKLLERKSFQEEDI